MYFSAFQSEYGISLSVSPGIIYLTSFNSDDACLFVDVDVTYRLYKYFNVGVGYYVLQLTQYKSETVSIGSSSSKINYGFKATGPMIFAEGTYPFFRWFNLGLMLATSAHTQDAANVPTQYLDPISGDSMPINERVLIESWQSHGMPFIMRMALKWNFLISKRLSISVLTGYVVATDYVPDVYEANGKRHWSNHVDQNGTFNEYDGHNFARYGDNSRVKVNLSGIALSFGAGLHF